jgi:DNA-binding LacI/PurR family transcriptional regulator
MSAAHSRGLRLPDDLSVIGVDNEDAGAVFDPPLTSIEVPIYEIGRAATQMLIDMIKGTGTAQSVEVPVERIIVRKSTCEAHVPRSVASL